MDGGSPARCLPFQSSLAIHAVLLANHGPVVAGSTLAAAADAMEELEATAKLHLLLRGEKIRPLDAAQVADLKRRYPL